MIDELLNKSLDDSDNFSLKEFLQRKLEVTGLSKTQFEKLANLQRRSLDGILDKTSKQTDIINLLKLGEFLDLTLEELIVYHLKDRPFEEIQELQNSTEITFINKYFDLKTLASLRFIDKNATVEDLSSRICEFFHLADLFDYERELNDALYSRTKRSFHDKMRDFWIKSSYKYFELIDNPNEYVRDDLKKLIPKIKPYTQNVEKGLLTVFRALFNIGITVVFQPMLPKTQIRGATFLIDDKPCIIITDLNKNYSTIWFSLLHELHHALFDTEQLSEIKYHLTGEPDLFLMQEDKANQFARDYLVSTEKMKFIEPLIHNPLMVSKFANEIQVHPSIIYSQFQFRQADKGKNYWGAFKEHFPDVELAKKNLNVSNWDVDSLEIAAQNVKKILTV